VTFFPDAELLAILEPIVGPGIQVIWDGDKEAIYNVNPYQGDQTPLTVDPSTVFSSGNFGSFSQFGCICKLTAKTVNNNGIDEPIREYDEKTDQLNTTYYGNRRLVLSVLVEADQISQAVEILERLRIRLQRQSIKDQLHAIGMAVEEIGTSTDVNARWDDRQIVAAVLDITFGFRVCDFDDTPMIGGGYIEKINDPNDPPIEPGPGPAYDIDGAGNPTGHVIGSTG